MALLSLLVGASLGAPSPVSAQTAITRTVVTAAAQPTVAQDAAQVVAPSPSPSPTATPAASCPPAAQGSPPVPGTSPSPSPAPSAPAPTADPCDPVEPDASTTPGTSQRPYLTPIPVVPAIPEPTLDATAAASPSPTPKPVKPGGVRAKLDVPISRRLPCYELPSSGCVNKVDIYYPRNAAGWPTVVTIHGRPRTPSDMQELARSLARGGAVVFNADYRGVRPVSRGFPESINDVACAIRYARANTAKYGGDPDHVVLVGHSYGGYVGIMVSVAGNRFAGKGIGCLEDRGSSLPDGFVHVAGVSITDPDEPLDAIYFGGSYASIPAVWERGDVFHQVALGGNPGLKVGIIFELHDPYLGYAHATWLKDALKRAGYDVHIQLLEEGHTHFDVLDMDTALGQRILEFSRKMIARTRPRD